MSSSPNPSPSQGSSLAARIGEAVAALVLGALVGIIGTFGHQLTWSELGFAIPLGLIAGLLAVAALLAGLRLALTTRLLPGLAALGIVTAVALLALPGANGSVLLPDNLGGVVWSVGPTLIAAVVLAWPSGLAASARGSRSGSGPVR